MWKKSCSKTYKDVSLERVWDIACDVTNWPTWHDDLEWCKMSGLFEVGNHFLLKPKGASSVKIDILEVNKYSSFTDCTTFFGAKMYDTHTFTKTPEGITLTNSVVVTGPLKWLWVLLVAKGVAKSSQEQMDELVMQAKK